MLLTISVLFLVPAIVFSTVPGGHHAVDINDSAVQTAHKFSLDKLATTSGFEEKKMKLISAESQVVSGTLITLKYEEIGENKTCIVKVWEQPWLNKIEITHSSCGHTVNKRSISKPNRTVMDKFNQFIGTHQKVYKNKAEYKKRYHIFKANLKQIKLLNENEQGTAKYGITFFADLSPQEFKRHLGLKKPEITPELPEAVIPKIDLPDEFDWRNYNAVTPVKNQGSCGSCWAFSVTGNIEGQWAIRKGELLSLSEQELVDCDKSDDGCGGGYMTTAYQSIVSLGGLETEKDYPYEAENEKCNLNNSEIEVVISGGVNITSDEEGMAQWLVANGPISIGVNANAMQFYMGGVSHPYKVFCNPENLDHGVLLVGYGVHTSSILHRTLPYWIIKNSWGKRWGELGYYRLYRGDGTCGVNRMASSATLD